MGRKEPRRSEMSREKRNQRITGEMRRKNEKLEKKEVKRQ